MKHEGALACWRARGARKIERETKRERERAHPVQEEEQSSQFPLALQKRERRKERAKEVHTHPVSLHKTLKLVQCNIITNQTPQDTISTVLEINVFRML